MTLLTSPNKYHDDLRSPTRYYKNKVLLGLGSIAQFQLIQNLNVVYEKKNLNQVSLRNLGENVVQRK